MQEPSWINVYDRMYRERIMFLKQYINDDFANTIISVLLYLESENANDQVSMYCNAYGGDTKAGLAIYDTMRCACTATVLLARDQPLELLWLPPLAGSCLTRSRR